jgi:hypothetical protein
MYPKVNVQHTSACNVLPFSDLPMKSMKICRTNGQERKPDYILPHKCNLEIYTPK